MSYSIAQTGLPLVASALSTLRSSHGRHFQNRSRFWARVRTFSSDCVNSWPKSAASTFCLPSWHLLSSRSCFNSLGRGASCPSTSSCSNLFYPSFLRASASRIPYLSWRWSAGGQTSTAWGSGLTWHHVGDFGWSILFMAVRRLFPPQQAPVAANWAFTVWTTPSARMTRSLGISCSVIFASHNQRTFFRLSSFKARPPHSPTTFGLKALVRVSNFSTYRTDFRPEQQSLAASQKPTRPSSRYCPMMACTTLSQLTLLNIKSGGTGPRAPWCSRTHRASIKRINPVARSRTTLFAGTCYTSWHVQWYLHAVVFSCYQMLG